ncbi:trypsin-like serine peptidase [Streptococcus cuniculi]|uniref:Serine protease n=1 Tax=Streptococcus cuniculi TaxID=1432788 RepID=A0A4Y9JFH1_9STRE|nr:serine protease [Streptococcus cuniculi]MBF0777539.1 trypsin-like peptidase domain-containing protein [Streptococcus cuniculi]TFU98585.1 serine protease [Streptococcus cuniculi]
MKQTYYLRFAIAGVLLLASSGLVACSNSTNQSTSIPTQSMGGETSKGSREQITDIASSQYSAVARIQSKTNSEEFGTGSFISPDTLMTNRHVLTALEKAEDTVVRVVTKDNKEIELPVKSFAIPDDESMDVGIVKLKEPISSNEQLQHIKPFALADEATIEKVKASQFIRTVGYPGDKELGSLWDSKGTITERDGNFLSFTAPIAGGSSGSPLFNDKNQVIGLANGSTMEGDKNPMSFGFLIDATIRDYITKHS